jgi:hypothetical protein
MIYLNGTECRYMFGVEGNKDYRIKTIRYKALLVAEKTLPFGTIENIPV